MSGFSTLKVEFLPVEPVKWFSPFRAFLKRKVRLMEDLAYVRPDGTEFVVPAGTESDGPSFPVILAWMLPSRLDAMESGIYHDYLCRVCKKDKAWADSEFRQALVSQGIRRELAYRCYLGLRAACWLRIRK